MLPYYKANWHHDVIADHLEKVERGEIDRLMIFMPPRHGKSELASILFPAWYIGRNPQAKVIAASYSSELAQDFGYQVRNHINDKAFQSVFNTTLKDDSKAKNNWRTDQGGHYLAVGAGGAVTGRGSDLLIIDDPVKNREEADSAVYREKIYRWYTSTAYTRLHKGGRIVLIQTRWHDSDLAGRLLKENPNEWTVLSFPAIATQQEECRDVGEPLWEDKYDLEALLRIKENVKEDWSPLYQQEPIDTTNTEFKPEWIRYYDKEPDRVKIRVIVDLASSEDKRSDENALCVVGQAADQRRFVLESWGDWETEGRRFDPGQMIEKIYETCDKWRKKDPALSIYVESVSYQRTLMYWLKEHAAKRRKEGLPIYRVEEFKTPTNRSKDDRIRALIPFVSNDLIWFPKQGAEELLNQMFRFPKAQRVDRLDVLCMDLDIDKKPRPHHVRTPEPVYSNGRIVKFK